MVAEIIMSARAWDLLSIALSAIAADTAARRNKSPDGCIRQFDLHVAVSQASQGDKQMQSFFTSEIVGGLGHLELNHNPDYPGANERSQRTWSIIFLVYGVLMASPWLATMRG